MLFDAERVWYCHADTTRPCVLRHEAVQLNVVAVEPAARLSDSPLGALGGAIGITEASGEGRPPPLESTGRTWNTYSVSLARLPMLVLRVDAPELGTFCQSIPAQVATVRNRYCHLLMLELVAAVQLSVALESPGAAVSALGPSGPAYAVTVTSDEALPAPAALTARTCIAYCLSPLRLGTVTLVVPATLPGTVVHTGFFSPSRG